MSADQTSQLKDTIGKIAELVFLCKQALEINDTVVDLANPINDRKLNNFFAPVQYAFFQTFTLDICKIFEQPVRYDLHSIPAAVPLMDATALKQRKDFEESCLAHCTDLSCISEMTDHDLVDFYKSETIRQLNSSDVTKKLSSFKTIRNKWVAHNEVVVINLSFNREHADYLLGFARRFVSTVGWSFCNIVYEDDSGDFALDVDAGRASRAARRILEHMGVVAMRKMHDDVRASMLATTIRQAEWSEAVKEKVKRSS